VVFPVVLTGGLAVSLLIIITHPSQASDKIDAVKTGLAVGAATGGVITLILAGRRQWHTEKDAASKQITELYTVAVDQLGSEKAPVRLGGLYALERLGQVDASQQQTIVNVICAYLRMPYTPPATQSPSNDASDRDHVEFEERTQERQVRLAAQRILADHLRRGAEHWPNIEVDLTGATLLQPDFTDCVIRGGLFEDSIFIGDPRLLTQRLLVGRHSKVRGSLVMLTSN
jgi:hypothetical protein